MNQVILLKTGISVFTILLRPVLTGEKAVPQTLHLTSIVILLKSHGFHYQHCIKPMIYNQACISRYLHSINVLITFRDDICSFERLRTWDVVVSCGRVGSATSLISCDPIWSLLMNIV